MLATFKSLGVTQFIPITVPNFTTGTGSFGVERTAYFDEHARAGRMKGTRGGTQAGRLPDLPAPIYLQQQRARMMMMMELQKATAHVDVYLVGSNNTGIGGAGRGAPAPRRSAAAAAAGRVRRRRRSATSATRTSPAIRRSTCRMVSRDTGGPTNAVIYAQPFRELEIIALAKAYQDAAGFHLRKPTKLDQTTTTQAQ